MSVLRGLYIRTMKDHVDVEPPRPHSQEEISSRSGGGELEQGKGKGRRRGEGEI